MNPSANGEVAMIWFGGAVSPQIIDDLYGVETVEELDIRMVSYVTMVIPPEADITPDSTAKAPHTPIYPTPKHLDPS